MYNCFQIVCTSSVLGGKNSNVKKGCGERCAFILSVSFMSKKCRAIKVDKINVSVEEDEHEPFTGMVCGIFGCIALRDGGGGIRSFHVRWPLTYIFF